MPGVFDGPYELFFKMADLSERPHVHVRGVRQKRQVLDRPDRMFPTRPFLGSGTKRDRTRDQAQPGRSTQNLGGRDEETMIQKLMIRKPDDADDWFVFVPVYIPDFDDVRRYAHELHSKRQPYKGEYKGWPVVYQPADKETPAEEWMIQFPASCQIGVWPLWAINFDWEEGDDQPPCVHKTTDNLVIDGKLPVPKTVDELLAEITQARERLGLV